MRNLTTFLLFTLVLVASIFLRVGDAVSDQDLDFVSNKTYSPTFLGFEDNKAYFAIRQPVNWTEAQAVCKEEGYTLAEISAEEVWQMLVGAYDATKFHHGHWTAGRDRQDLYQFKWNGTSKVVGGTTYLKFGRYENGHPYQTCLAFMALSPATATYVTSFPCSQKLNALCELVPKH